MFRRLLKLRSKALKLLKNLCRQWRHCFLLVGDPRTPLGSLYSFLGESCPSQLGVPLFALVSDVRKNGSSWSLPPTIIVFTHMLSGILSLAPSPWCSTISLVCFTVLVTYSFPGQSCLPCSPTGLAILLLLHLAGAQLSSSQMPVLSSLNGCSQDYLSVRG